MLLLTIFAQGATATPTGKGSGGAGGAGSLIFFALIIGAMYFLMIRPQRTRQRAHQDMVRLIEVGDEVETVAGMYGRVRRATDEAIWVEIIPGAEPAKMARAAIRRRVIEPDPGSTT